MNASAPFAAAALACAVVLCSCESRTAQAGDPGAHVGTVAFSVEHPLGAVGAIDRTELLVAYYKSDLHAADLRALTALRDAAEGEDRAEIEAFGASTQALAHRQLAGDEPLYAVLGRLDPHVRSVMHERGLSRIVMVDADTDFVDVTEDVVTRIEPAAD